MDKRVVADAKVFCRSMCEALAAAMTVGERYFSSAESWRKQCLLWKEKYPVVTAAQKSEENEPVNVYGFMDALSGLLPEESLTAVSNGACCVSGHQSYIIKRATRFIVNNAVASMGYGLPAAIGLCIAAGKKTTICLEGDGSIMMNLQELQTVMTGKLPIKIFLINNEGYHSIRLTQNNVFSGFSKVGIGPESGDLSFPRFELVAKAFGYDYLAIHSGKELKDTISRALLVEGPVFCEVFTDTIQAWEPKSTAKRQEDGTLVSSPLEDLAPFLSREELGENMYI